MAKQKNRKKQLRNQLRRSGQLSLTQKVSDAAPHHQEVHETFHKSVNTTPVEVGHKASQAVDLDGFKALPELVNVRQNLAETLYEAGIHSARDFSQWTEKDVLALKGIGKATLDKLKENGVNFKAE